MWWKENGAKYPRLVHHLALSTLEFQPLMFIRKITVLLSWRNCQQMTGQYETDIS